MESLYDSDDSFTLVFQASLIPNMKWRKSNYPIPQCLIQDGKFKGEIIITASYNPPLDPNAGSEYVRANVELSFGVLDGESMKGKVPMEGEKEVAVMNQPKLNMVENGRLLKSTDSDSRMVFLEMFGVYRLK